MWTLLHLWPFNSSTIGYNQLDQEAAVTEEENQRPLIRFHKYEWLKVSMTVVLIIVAAAMGFEVGRHSQQYKDSNVQTRAFRVPIEDSKATFRYNTSFAAPPPPDGKEEPIWDSLIPNGLGYVNRSDQGTHVLTAFHQLHCLYTIRRIFYSQGDDGQLKAFDLGKARMPHMAHCFDYLRQGIICSADSTVEPAVDKQNGFLGSGFERKCRDFVQLKEWAEKHRAFDAHGFLAEAGHA